MESTNPYQPPRADLSGAVGTGVDLTQQFDPSGRFGRLIALSLVALLVAVIAAPLNPELMEQLQQALSEA